VPADLREWCCDTPISTRIRRTPVQCDHSPDQITVTFDDNHAVADAGLLLAANLAEGLLLRELFDTHIDLGDAHGAANAGDKAMTLVHAALAGGEWIGDADRLRAGATGQVLGHRVAAPSTLGTFLRSFTWGSARQLDQVAGEALRRAWQAGAGPGPWPLTIDIDSTHCETYGLQKQGATGIDRHGERGYHPLLATIAGTGDVVGARLREGVANTGHGAASFVTEAINRARRAGATGAITLRADSGFYAHKVIDACHKQGVTCSVTVKLSKAVHKVIAQIPERAWTPIPYWLDDGADVAETSYRPFGRKGRTMRLIVRRVRPTPGSQLALFCDYDYHGFVTDRDGDTLELEADHRRHAEVENVIRDLKYGVGLGHLPSGKFAANAAWLTLGVIAHNLARWTSRIGLGETLITTKTLRTRYLDLPGRLTRSTRKLHLHLPTRWPWAREFLLALDRLRCVPFPT
jgi:Transposase DDE domain group 1